MSKITIPTKSEGDQLTATEFNQIKPAVNSLYIMFNPMDYGAVGNGTTNDQVAVQNAINAAHVNGGCVLFPQGTYLVNSLAWYPNVDMRGVSQKASILKSAAASPLIYSYSTSEIEQPSASISDLTLEGNNIGTIAVDITGVYHTTFNRLLVQNFTVKGFQMKAVVCDVWNKCYISNCVTGVTLEGYDQLGLSNLNVFNQSNIQLCTNWALIMDNASGLSFNNCDFEVNGSANNLNTGCIKLTSPSPLNEGVALNMNGGWFERNHGSAIVIGTQGEPSNGGFRSILTGVIIQYPQTGNTLGISIQENQHLTLIGCTIDGQTTDVLADGANAIVNLFDSTVGQHTETNGGVYSQNQFDRLANLNAQLSDFNTTPQVGSIKVNGFMKAPSGHFLELRTDEIFNEGRINITKGNGGIGGTATLVNGTVTLTQAYNVNPSSYPNALIFLSIQTAIGTPGYLSYSRYLNTLTITSTSSSDNSVVNWLILH